MSEPDSEIERLRLEVKDHRAEIQELRQQLASFKSFSERLENKTEEMLFHFFDRDTKLTAEDLAGAFREKVNVIEAHLSTLRGRGLIDSSGSLPQPYMIGESPRYSLAYLLTPKGTRWVMAKRGL